MTHSLPSAVNHRRDDWTITLTEVTEADRPTLMQLMQFYKYDATYYTGEDIMDSGHFTTYFEKGERFHYYFIHVNANLAGYVLVERSGSASEGPYTVFENLFLLTKYCDEGIERDVIRMVFDYFPGQWKIFTWPMVNSYETAIFEEALNLYVGDKWTSNIDADADLTIYYFHTDDKIDS